MQLGARFQTFLLLSAVVGAFLLISGLAERPSELRIVIVAGMLAPACLALLSQAPLKWSLHGRHSIGRHR